MLLDKVLEVPSCKGYTQYVKAFLDATHGDMTDYQAIVKLLVEQHRQQCAASGVSGQRGDRHDGDARRGGSLDKCMMGDIQGPRPHHGTGHGAHSSTGGCQRWSNLAA